MLLNFKNKKKLVLNLKKQLNKSLSILVFNFNNLSSNNLNNLRKIINKNNSFIKVIKNNLLKLSVKDTKLKILIKFLSGPTIICYSLNSISILSKILLPFINNETFILKHVFINKKLISLELNKKLSYFNNKKKAVLYFIYYLRKISILRLLNILKIVKKNK